MQKIDGGQIARITRSAILIGLLGQGVLMVTGIAAARLLGPDGRGQLAMLLVAPAVVTAVGMLGVPQALVTLASANPARARDVIREAWSILCWQVVVLTGLYFMVLTALDPIVGHVSLSLRILSSSAVIIGLLNAYLAAVLQASLSFRQLNYLRIVPLSLYAAGLCALWAMGLANVAMVLAMWIVAHATYFFILGWMGRHECLGFVRHSKSGNHRLLSFGLKGHLGSLSTIDLLQIDRLVIGLATSQAALGHYVVAQSFSNLPRIVVGSANQVVAPSLASGLLRARSLFVKGYALGAISMLVLGALLILSQPVVLPFLFGEDFAGAVAAAQILIGAGFVAAARKFFTDGMWALGRPRIGSISEGIVLLTFCAGATLTFPNLGMMHVATLVLAAQSCALAYTLMASFQVVFRDGTA